jgi:hypothetical protein
LRLLSGEKTPNKTETEISVINQRIIAKMQQITAKEQQIVEALRGENLLRAAGKPIRGTTRLSTVHSIHIDSICMYPGGSRESHSIVRSYSNKSADHTF